MSLFGIDVSGYQPSGISTMVPADFVIAKATEGVGYVSSTCVAQLNGALNSGKRAGFYHFISMDDPIVQADFFCRQTAGFFWRGVQFLDWEGAGMGLGASGARTFVDRVRSNMGVLPPIYMSLSPASQAQYKALIDAGLWVAYGANYTTPQGYEGAPASSSSGVFPSALMRQFTSAGRLPGYGGNLDLDVFYGDKALWDHIARGSTPTRARRSDDMPIAVGYQVGGGSVFWNFLIESGRIKNAPDDQAQVFVDASGTSIVNINQPNMRKLLWDLCPDFVTSMDIDTPLAALAGGKEWIAPWRRSGTVTLTDDQVATLGKSVSDTVVAALPAAGATPDQVEAAVKTALDSLTLKPVIG